MKARACVRRMLVVACTLALAHAAGACRGGGEAVVIVGEEEGHLAIVDGTTGRVLSRPGGFGRSADATLSADGSVLYVRYFTEPNFLRGGSNELAAVDPRTGRVRWRRSLTMPGRESATLVGGFELYGSAVAESPDGSRLLVSHALRPEDHGRVFEAARVAALDLAHRRRFVATAGPLWVYSDGLATLPPGRAAPRGAVLAIGTRRRGTAPSLDWLYVIDPATLAVIDSAAVTPPADHDGGTLSGMLVAPDGRRVYLQTLGGQLVAYDLVTRTVVGRADVPRGASLALARNGRRLYAAAPWGSGSSRIVVLETDGPGGAIAPVDTFDPGALVSDRSGAPPAIGGMASSRDGTRLYVAAGTASIGLSYAPQMQRLLVLDAKTGALVRDVQLERYGAPSVFVP